MYNTDDKVNGVTTRECFHAILDSALENKDDHNESQKYFDVIRQCLGIDFSMSYNANADILFQMDCHECTEESFEANISATPENMHKEIDRIFDLISPMVVDGEFSKNYYNYLKERKLILEDLIHYYNTEGIVLAQMSYLKDKETSELQQIININKESTLRRTKKLLNERLEEIVYNESINKLTLK